MKYERLRYYRFSKPLSLAKFNGHNEPHEHVSSINTQMEIIGNHDSLECKLLSRAFRDTTLRWYICLLRLYITNYRDMVKKLIHQFATSTHGKMVTTSLFNISQGTSESLREYLAYFNDDTIKVINPNQKMFEATFNNRLKVRHFNKSLAQRPSSFLSEVITRIEWYIKSEKSNAKIRPGMWKNAPLTLKAHSSLGRVITPRLSET